jgi:hypothetical protein
LRIDATGTDVIEKRENLQSRIHGYGKLTRVLRIDIRGCRHLLDTGVQNAKDQCRAMTLSHHSHQFQQVLGCTEARCIGEGSRAGISMQGNRFDLNVDTSIGFEKEIGAS